ncbi:MAG TPA: hypothetical protein VK892_23555 [Pyrinomonadaceae bacterium]|nr:hypothetical protein [Pyrinomonadaceae bacterium]
MAKIATIDGAEKINVSGSVGKNGVNFKDDVMVVQALLKYGLPERRVFRNVSFPQPTGTIDRDTIRLIRQFQEHWNRTNKFVKLPIDARVDPAQEEGRQGNGKTILKLNDNAFEYWLLKGAPNGNYINDLLKRFPQLNSVFSEGVGSLGFPLEPSAPRVGTLNLSLA